MNVSKAVPICILLMIATAFMPMAPVSAYSSHAAIVIVGDSGFTNANGVTTGTGTAADPFIISGWEIAVTGNGISIQGTIAAFKITSCKLTGMTGAANGIALQDVHNGTIMQNDISGITNAISVQDGTNMGISQNTLKSFTNGVALQDSIAANIFQNTFDTGTNGISSQDNKVVKIYSNTFKGQVNGIAIEDQTMGDEIYDNIFEGGTSAISASNVMNAIIRNNEFSNASSSAVKISGSSSGSNKIYANDFRNNHGGKQADTTVASDKWYDTTQNKGNFWSDWYYPDANLDGIVDSPYVFAGAINQDSYPRTTPLKGPIPIPPLVTSIAASPVSGVAPLLVTFTVNASGGVGPYTNNITYGDGTSGSTLTHTYNNGGTFVVSVTTKDSKGTAKTSGTISLTFLPPLHLNITSTTITGKAPLAVGFTSTVTGGQTPYNYSWDFGDGQKSVDASPTHIYKNMGIFDAKCTVKDAKGNTKTQSIHIVAVKAPGKGFIPGFEAPVLVISLVAALVLVWRRKAN